MEEFIKTLTEQIRCAKARDGVARELSAHILDQAQAYEAEGMAHEEAVQKAVDGMGDPVSIGAQLDRIHRPQTDWKLLLMTFLLSAAGLLLLFTVGGLSGTPGAFARQCVFTLAGFAVTAGIYFLDYSFLGKYPFAVWLLLTAGFLVTAMAAPRVNGRVTALYTLVYLYIPVFAGILYRFRGGGYGGIAKSLLFFALTALLSTSFAGSAFIGMNIYAVCAALLLLAVWKDWFSGASVHVHKKYAIALITAAALLLPAAALVYGLLPGTLDYGKTRILAFLHPYDDKYGAGYVYLAIREGLAGANIVGASNPSQFVAGGSLGALLPLNLACTYGLLAACAVFAALAVFLIHVLHITRQQKNRLGMMISAACFLVFFINCVEGLLINVGLFPLTDVPIPFLSAGASAVLTYAVFTGLLLSVHRHEKILTEDAAPCQPAWKLTLRLERR